MKMWYSLHGFIHDFNAIDYYLQISFPQVVQKGMDKFFFIRYWLGGPHIRLRFKTEEGNYLTIKERFEDSIENYIQHHKVNLIDYENFYQNTMLENENIEKTYWCPHGSVEEFVYRPEYVRYGGENAMERSEDVFYQSSLMSVILNKLPYHKRIIAGLDLIYLTFQQAGADKDIYGYYANMWKSYSNNELDFDFANNNILKKRLKTLQEIKHDSFTMYRDYFDCLRDKHIIDDVEILVSHVHMTNNRIGVTPVLEYELATFIYNHL